MKSEIIMEISNSHVYYITSLVTFFYFSLVTFSYFSLVTFSYFSLIPQCELKRVYTSKHDINLKHAAECHDEQHCVHKKGFASCLTLDKYLFQVSSW